MTKQLQFSFIPKIKIIHGGDQARGKRKSERPLRMNKPIHVVLRAKRSGLKTKERSIQKILVGYIIKNQLEALGLVSYTPRTG